MCICFYTLTLLTQHGDSSSYFHVLLQFCNIILWIVVDGLSRQKCIKTRSSAPYRHLILAPAEGLWPLATFLKLFNKSCWRFLAYGNFKVLLGPISPIMSYYKSTSRICRGPAPVKLLIILLCGPKSPALAPKYSRGIPKFLLMLLNF